jgi:hypothetical protein
VFLTKFVGEKVLVWLKSTVLLEIIKFFVILVKNKFYRKNFVNYGCLVLGAGIEPSFINEAR